MFSMPYLVRVSSPCKLYEINNRDDKIGCNRQEKCNGKLLVDSVAECHRCLAAGARRTFSEHVRSVCLSACEVTQHVHVAVADDQLSAPATDEVSNCLDLRQRALSSLPALPQTIAFDQPTTRRTAGTDRGVARLSGT